MGPTALRTVCSGGRDAGCVSASEKSPFAVTDRMHRPISAYFLVEPPDPSADWFPSIVAAIKLTGQDVVSSEVNGGLLRVRTQQGRTFLAVTVEARQVPEGFVAHWQYSIDKRSGWLQRFLTDRGEDANRFVDVFTQLHKAKVRSLTDAEGQARMAPPAGDIPPLTGLTRLPPRILDRARAVSIWLVPPSSTRARFVGTLGSSGFHVRCSLHPIRPEGYCAACRSRRVPSSTNRRPADPNPASRTNGRALPPIGRA